MLENAARKRKAKGADWIVANDVSPATGIMGGDRNTVHLVTAEGVESWPELDKGEVARRLHAARGRAAGRDHRRDVKRKRPAPATAASSIASCACRTAAACRCPPTSPTGAAGIDLLAAVPKQRTAALAPGARALVPTGLVLELPPGFEAQVRPRSGLALRHGITVLNSPGTIDSDYRGEVQVLLVNLGDGAVRDRARRAHRPAGRARVEQAPPRRGRRARADARAAPAASARRASRRSEASEAARVKSSVRS